MSQPEKLNFAEIEERKKRLIRNYYATGKKCRSESERATNRQIFNQAWEPLTLTGGLTTETDKLTGVVTFVTRSR